MKKLETYWSKKKNLSCKTTWNLLIYFLMTAASFRCAKFLWSYLCVAFVLVFMKDFWIQQNPFLREKKPFFQKYVLLAFKKATSISKPLVSNKVLCVVSCFNTFRTAISVIKLGESVKNMSGHQALKMLQQKIYKHVFAISLKKHLTFSLGKLPSRKKGISDQFTLV